MQWGLTLPLKLFVALLRRKQTFLALHAYIYSRSLFHFQLNRKRPYLIYKISALLSVCMGNEPKGMKCDFKRRLCFLCDARQAASPKHILFECDIFSSARTSKLKLIMDSMPNGMKNSFMSMDLDGKTTLLLSGLHCDKYVEEWSQLMINICEFVYDIYRQRKIVYDSMFVAGIT